MEGDPRAGTEIAGYRVLSVLGRGTRSVVYLAVQADPSRRVALKVLAPEVADDPAFRERFLRESGAAASLEHPNIVPIHAAGEADGVLYVAMRPVEGEDLGRLVDWWGISPQQAASILGQVAAALDAAHEKGLVHGAVRSRNILVSRGAGPGTPWHAYLTGFGLGRSAGDTDGAAPEQLAGGEVDRRADVFALGRVARRCMPANTAVDAVIAKATAASPEDRYPTAGDFARALERAVESSSVPIGGPAAPPLDLDGAETIERGLFVGRDHELAELLGGLRDAVSGRGRLFLLAGEPGIGKSRLADELGAVARGQGCRVLWGRCWEGGGAPAYWPWVQLLRSCLRGQDPATVRGQIGAGAIDVAQMLPELRGLFPDLSPPPSVDPESARFQLFDSTATFLRNAADAVPLILVIDDLQAADTASVLLLRFLAGQLGESHLLVVATYRDMELTPNHPLAGALPELEREPATRRLTLHGLREADVAAFIEQAARVAPPSGLVSALSRETNGNPLFLREAVQLLAAEGRLGDVTDTDSLGIAVPAGVREVIGRRVDRLGDACRQALMLGSVLGPEFTLEVLRRLADLSADQLLDALDEAVRAGLLSEVPGALGRFRFSHDLVREALYEELASARRVRLHRKAGEVLEELFGQLPQPHLAELAHHFFEAARGGDAGKAVEYARLAGDQAAGALAYEEAARLYRMALQVLELAGTPEGGVRCDLLLALGEAHSRAGDLAAGRDAFLEAAAIARRAGSALQLAKAALGYGGRFTWARAGDDPHLTPLLQDALVLLGGSDERIRVRLLTRLACALRDSPDREHCAALSQQAVDMARRLGDPSTLGYALGGRCWAIWWPENPEERLELGAELLLLATEAHDGELMVDGHLVTEAALTDMGRMDLARAEVESIWRVGEELRQPTHRWLGRAISAYLALMEGNFGRAEELLDEGLRESARTPVRDNISTARCQLFLLRREQGRVAEVEDIVRASVREFPWYPLHRAALACVLLDLDRPEEARAVFDSLARDGFGALHRDSEWLLGMGLAADACFMLGDAQAAEVLYEQLLPFRGRHAVGHAEGSVGAVDRYLGLLAATLGRLEVAERHFQEGIEMNERMGARPWAAHTRHDFARMLLARGGRGDRERADELLRTALATARELGMSSLEAKVSPFVDEQPAPETAPSEPTAEPTARPSVFRREGEYWSIAFGGDAFRLHDSKGLHHLARLLAAPGREIHALDLVGGEEGQEPERSAIGDAGAMLDPQAKAAYRGRLDDLREELEEAESWNDPERAARAREEMEFLARELAGAVGLGGRDRRAASSAERARVNVTRAIRAALGRIAEHSPALGRHLEATVRTGTFCSYVPDPRLPLTWQL